MSDLELRQNGFEILSTPNNCADVGATSSDWLLVGDWSMNLLLYSLPDMALVEKESLGGDVIPRR